MSSRHVSFLDFQCLASQSDENAEEIARFLDAIVATSGCRRRRLPKGRSLFRAQRGYVMREDREAEAETPDALFPERMKPLREGASEGRVNPKGKPCLYLATDPDTAMAEVRPWVGAHISLAQFKAMKDCTLIDFSLDKVRTLDLMLRGEPATPDEEEKAIWGDIAYAFAAPLTQADVASECLATQAISERFRREGYDGIAYQSAPGRGKCIALFDLNAADLAACALHATESVTYTLAQVNNWYCIPKHHQHVADSIEIDVSSPQAALPHFLRIKYLLPEGDTEAPTPERDADGQPSDRERSEKRFVAIRPPSFRH